MEQASSDPALEMAGLPAVWVGPTVPEAPSPIEKIKRADEAREGFPGEHWLVLALGVAIWHYTRRDARWVVRTAGALAASMLAARAATGRDGLAKVLRYTPLGGRISACPPCEQGDASQPER
jgi:hypothetical protein